MVEEADEERWHPCEEYGPDPPDGPEQIGEIAWVGHDCQGVAGDERVPLHADVSVDMEARQREEDDASVTPEDGLGPRFNLKAGEYVGSVPAEHAFGRAGRAAAHQEDGRVVQGQGLA